MAREPLYIRIREDLKEAIDKGTLPEGARIPAELELAAQYRVSRNPTRQALRELELAGYIVRSRRRGSFVAPRSHRTRPLHLGESRVLALICPPMLSHHVQRIIHGFVEGVSAAHYNALLYFMDSAGKTQAELLRDIRQSGLAGVALWLYEEGEGPIRELRECQAAGFPFVLLDRYDRNLDCDLVVSDNERIGYEAAHALIERGHRTIGFFGSEYNNTATEERLQGFLRALREAGLERNQELTAALSPREDIRAFPIHRVVAHKSRPTAFFCAEAWIAILAAQELRRLGYALPGDAELACLDDGELVGEHANLTDLTLQQQSFLMGRTAVETLVQRIEEPAAPPRKTFLEPTHNNGF
ncbi:MAG TPA: GntR family transcriptional regulator [Candidatus Hydrogenedentes bacterium]|nr:GntR family transcriptional regulator [Candidatus Hydrogenedentota bacterium]